MKCVIGLGNPGPRYTATRHNVGFMVVDALAKAHQLRFKTHTKWRADVAVGDQIILVKPLTYMNISGEAVVAVMKYYQLTEDDIIVIHDDLALPPYTLRFRPAGGAGGHNGIKSIIAHLGHQQFKRGRIGIGSSPAFMDTSDYVLQPFPKAESPLLDEAVDKTVQALKRWFSGTSFENLMTQTNEKSATPLS